MQLYEACLLAFWRERDSPLKQDVLKWALLADTCGFAELLAECEGCISYECGSHSSDVGFARIEELRLLATDSRLASLSSGSLARVFRAIAMYTTDNVRPTTAMLLQWQEGLSEP